MSASEWRQMTVVAGESDDDATMRLCDLPTWLGGD
jgi:hypothetical protein